LKKISMLLIAMELIVQIGSTRKPKVI